MEIIKIQNIIVYFLKNFCFVMTYGKTIKKTAEKLENS